MKAVENLMGFVVSLLRSQTLKRAAAKKPSALKALKSNTKFRKETADALEIIRDNAEFVVEFPKENNTPADYDASAIQWLEDYIEKRRDSFTSKQADLLIWTIGSFLGECMCRAYNGVWVERDGDWGVDMENGALVGSHSGK